MRVYEILNEAIEVDEFRYGSWIIRAAKNPNKTSGKYKAIGYWPKKDIGTVKGSGDTQDQAIQNVKSHINNTVASSASDSNKQNPNIKFSDVIKTSAVLNVPFTREILNGYEPTAARFKKVGGITYFDVATQESYRDSDMPEIFKSEGFVKMGYRNLKGTEGYSIGITPNQVERLGLEFSARYVLDETKTDDPSYRRFSLHLNSYVQGKTDKYELGVPGITIATWTPKDEYT